MSKGYLLPEPIGDNTHFTWGPILEIHSVLYYDIVQYLHRGLGADGEDLQQFHVYVNGQDCSRSLGSLDDALLCAIDLRNNGMGSNAAAYARRVLLLPERG